MGDRVYPEPVAGIKDEADHDPGAPGPVRTVTYQGKPGIVQSVDSKSLVDRATKADVVIELVPRLGDLVSAGSALFRVHGNRVAIDDEWLRGTVATGDERTMRQDPAFGFRLLADISAKALSPGVNDPTTSTQALDQIDLLLRQVGGRRLAPRSARQRRRTATVRYHSPPRQTH